MSWTSWLLLMIVIVSTGVIAYKIGKHEGYFYGYRDGTADSVEKWSDYGS